MSGTIWFSTFLKSELGYQCLIFRVNDHYGQFQMAAVKSVISPEMYYQTWFS